ncbi:MAG: C45 family peptidase [Thermoplasmata archaeon]|nr:C45 family peptidase [Thermoplasmata archaeon]
MQKKAKATLRTASAKGTHREIGIRIGEQCRDIARRMDRRLRNEARGLIGRSPSEDIARARKVLPATRRFAPGYVEELEGYAEGAGLSFDRIFVMMCVLDWEAKGCTDIAVSERWTKDDCVYAAHNEDVEPCNLDDIVMARIDPDDEPGYIGMSYGGIMPTVAINAAGISITGNALEPNDLRPGIPKMIVVREIMRAEGLHDALKLSMPRGRGHSFNNIVCDSNGEIYSMEGSATTFDAIYAEEGYLVHTNHYLSPRMWKFEADMHSRFSSIMRYNRAKKLFRQEVGEVDVSTFMRVLSDHVGYPESICRHPDPKLSESEQTMTIFSSVFDLTNKAIWVCPGNPCTGTYERHDL